MTTIENLRKMHETYIKAKFDAATVVQLGAHRCVDPPVIASAADAPRMTATEVLARQMPSLDEQRATLQAEFFACLAPLIAAEPYPADFLDAHKYAMASRGAQDALQPENTMTGEDILAYFNPPPINSRNVRPAISGLDVVADGPARKQIGLRSAD